MIFKKAFQKKSEKKEEVKKRTQTETQSEDFKILDNPEQIHVETFEDLLNGASEEIKNDFRSQLKTVQPQRKVYLSSNRKGMTIDNNFLDEVLSQRHEDLHRNSDEAEGDAMFSNPVYRTQVDSMVSMEDFHDKFFGRQAQINQSVDAIYMEKKQIKNDVSSDHSFEVVDYDSEITSNQKVANQQSVQLNVKVELPQSAQPVKFKDTSNSNSTEELLQQPTSLVNATTTPSESSQSSSELHQQKSNQSLLLEPENRPTADFSQLQNDFQEQAENMKQNTIIVKYQISQEIQNSQIEESKFSSSIDSRSSNQSQENFNQIQTEYQNRPTADFQDLNSSLKQINYEPSAIVESKLNNPDSNLKITSHDNLPEQSQEQNKFLEDAQIILISTPKIEEASIGQESVEFSFPPAIVKKSPRYSLNREQKSQNMELEQSSAQLSQSIENNLNLVTTDSYFNKKRFLEAESLVSDPYELPLQKSSISNPIVGLVAHQQTFESEDVTRQKIRKLKSNAGQQKRNSLALQQTRILTSNNLAGRISVRPEAQQQNLQPIGDDLLDDSFCQDEFVDYTNLVSRNRDERKSAINLKDRKKSLLVKMTAKEYTMKELNSSESNITDKSFEDGTSLNSVDIERLLQGHDQLVAQDENFLQDLMEFQNDAELDPNITDTEQNKDTNQLDFLKILNESENTAKFYADTKFKDIRKNNDSQKPYHNTLKVFTDAEIMGGISKTFGQHEKKTCIFVQNEYILIGSSTGVLYVYNKDTEQLVGTHREDGKDFADNFITCIDVHQTRTKYCVIGFQKGQLAIIDLTDIKKTIKLIKDHHKKPIVSVKFCDWIKEKPHFNLGQQHKCNECSDVKAWMFVSVDTDGKVVQNTITNVYVGLYANDFVVFDPSRYYQSQPFEVLASRYVHQKYQTDIQDTSTIIAMANSESVVITLLGDKISEQKFMAEKPLRYPSQNQNCVQPILSKLPCICWGHGKTPRFNFQTFPLLAIAWGPLIQIVVFKNINEGAIIKDDFQLDGYYIIAQSNAVIIDQVDITIESLQFIDESILVAVTSNKEIRMFYTEKFKECEFSEPQYLQQLNFEELDSRCKMLPSGTNLTQKQIDIELERDTKLVSPIQQSLYGQQTAQTISAWDDKIVYISQAGVFKLQHLSWLDNLLQLNKKAQINGQWIDVFQRALDIYKGKIKGLRIEGSDEGQKREKMRSQLKSFIESIIDQIIRQIKVEKKLADSGVPNTQDFLSSNISKLIKLIIEFCIEIADPVFMFDTIQFKFAKEELAIEFAEEIKQYVLAGTFSEIQIKEQILEKGVIGPYKEKYLLTEMSKLEKNYAEEVDKIIMNIRFDGCSKEYVTEQIKFCQQNNFSSAAMYLSQACFQDQGPLHALAKLRDFYFESLARESENNELRLQVEDIYELQNLPPTSQKRHRIETSSVYLGFKILWATRRYLLGKKVPQGHFTFNQQHILSHDILDFITQDDMIDLFLGIDAAAYFQIISIVFNNPSQQYSFVKSGRPAQKTTYYPLLPQNQSVDQEQQKNLSKPLSMNHDLIVKRISSYFDKLDIQNQFGQLTEASPTRLRYLCFIASISGSYEKSEQNDTKLQYEVALELIRNADTLIGYNKDHLQRRMTNKQMYRGLTHGGNSAPDELKHPLLIPNDQAKIRTEEMLLMLVERSKPILEDQNCLDQLLKAVDRTNFIDLKLVLYDLNHDYLKCLRLFMQHKEGRPKLSLVTIKGEIDGYDWLQDKFKKLSSVDNNFIKQQILVFQREILSHVLFLIKFNTAKTVMLCDTVFSSAHLQILEALQGEQQWQLVYIQQLIELKKEEIKQLVVSSGHNQTLKKTSGEVEQWKVLLAMHVKLLCILEPSRVAKEIDKIVKDHFYPTEDCLKICMDFKQIEACAILNKKLGNYSESISQFLKVLQNEMNFERFKKELYYFDKDQQKTFMKEQQTAFTENVNRLSSQIGQFSDMNVVKLLIQSAVKSTVTILRKEKIDNHYKAWVNRFGKNIELLDRILFRIQHILQNHAKDLLEVQGNDVWVQVLQVLFQILFHPSLRKKSYCKRHLKQKITDFCRSILQQISFKSLILAASSNNKSLKYKAIRELVEEVFCDKTREIDMSISLKNQSESDLLNFQREADKNKATGFVFTSDSFQCQICQKAVNEKNFKSQLVIQGSRSSKLDRILIFDCDESFGALKIQHAYHVRCMNKTIQEEISKQEALKKEPLSDAALLKLFRCVTCHPKNQMILQSDEKKQTDSSEVSNSHTSDSTEEFSQVRQSIRKTMALKPTTLDQRLQQKKKLMLKFEETQMNNERLTLQDFNLNNK